MCPCGSVDDEDVRFKMASNKQKSGKSTDRRTWNLESRIISSRQSEALVVT